MVRRSPEISHRRVGVHTGNGRAGVTVGDLGPRGTSRDLGPKNRELGSEVEITGIRTQISRLREVGRGRSRLAGGRRSRRDLGPQIWAQSPYHVGGHTPVPFGHHRHITLIVPVMSWVFKACEWQCGGTVQLVHKEHTNEDAVKARHLTIVPC